MRAFLRLIIGNPITAIFFAIILGISGLYSFVHMPVDLFPKLSVPVVNIISHTPAASPEDMELLVTRPIEDEMRSIPGVKRVASTSVEGISQVTVQFGWGTTTRDARQLVQARLSRLSGILPQGTVPRLENIGTTLQEVCGYVIFGAGSPVVLRNIVRYDLAGRLMGVEGVSSVEVLGGDRRAFYVIIRPKKLKSLHLTLENVVSALKAHNGVAVSGFLNRSAREYLIRGDARIRDLSDIRAIPLTGSGGKTMLLGSLAEVREGRAPRHYIVHGDGIPAVALIIRKQPGASTTRVVAGVDKAMSRLQSLLPAGTRVKKFYDQSEIIRESQGEILRDLLIGAGLAILVLFFFLAAWRPTLIVAATIPITFLATLTLMNWAGLSLNVITMTALALAIGMIVDDAIVVAENIFRHARLTPDVSEACIRGTTEIAGPDASGTFTTVAAFLPMVMVTGIAGLFLRPFGFTISAALLVSLALSLTMVPMLFSRGKKIVAVKETLPGPRLVRAMGKWLQSVLTFTFRHKALTLILATAFLGLAGLSIFLGRASVLPPIDEGAILIEYVTPPGTSLRESNRIGCLLDTIAMRDPDVSCVYRRTGSPGSSYMIEGVNRGELMIKLAPKGERRRSLTSIMDTLKASYSKIPGVVFLYHQPTQEKIDESFSGLPALFGVTLYGNNTDTLVNLANRVETVLSADPAISNVVNNTKIKSPKIQVRLNNARLGLYGVSVQDVLDTLQAARLGVQATQVIRQRAAIPVLVKLALRDPLNLALLKKLPVVTHDGTSLPLSHVADVQILHTPSAITRLNGRREITLLAEVEGNIPKVVSRLRGKLRNISFPPGYSFEFTGQYKVLMNTVLEMAGAIIAAIVLIYLIMAMQFSSWLQPLIILLTIPLSLVGALVALFATRQGVDVSVGMGAFTLVGIAVNNAIVLMDYANKERKSGTPFHNALISAAKVRLRPILLTSLTTIFALLPVAIGTTVGSKIFQPFAITVIGGLLSATLATLIVVPTLAFCFMGSKK